VPARAFSAADLHIGFEIREVEPGLDPERAGTGLTVDEEVGIRRDLPDHLSIDFDVEGARLHHQAARPDKIEPRQTRIALLAL